LQSVLSKYISFIIFEHWIQSILASTQNQNIMTTITKPLKCSISTTNVHLHQFLSTQTAQLRLAYAINPGSQTLFHNHHHPLVIQNSKPLISETTESNGTRITKIDHALDSDLPLNFKFCFLDTPIREVQLRTNPLTTTWQTEHKTIEEAKWSKKRPNHRNLKSGFIIKSDR
jgi:hypothetical protein